MSCGACNDIIETLEAIGSCVDLWRLARDEGLVPDAIARTADIIETPNSENFDARRLEMGHHKVHVSVVCEKSNPIRIGSSKVFRCAIDIEKQARLRDIRRPR